MRKVGDILKKRRLEKNLTLEDIEKRTKIRKKFLDAIEKGEYNLFSSGIILRGFVKNYSDFLNLDTEEILAVFRREFDKQEKVGIVPKDLSDSMESSIARITPIKVTVLSISFLLVLFFGYLIKGYLTIASSPQLIISKPVAGDKVTTDKVVVEGKTDSKAKVKINNQEIFTNNDGSFTQEVRVNKSTTMITVVAENESGKKTVVERVIEVIAD